MDVTRDEFLAYERVRRGGKFNMITEQGQAARKAKLSPERYRAVMKQYTEARQAYFDEGAFSQPGRGR